MTIGSQEHYDMMASFEKYMKQCPIPGRLDREDKSIWRKGHIYQDGNTNDLFNLYCAGYSHARCEYMNG